MASSLEIIIIITTLIILLTIIIKKKEIKSISRVSSDAKKEENVVTNEIDRSMIPVSYQKQ